MPKGSHGAKYVGSMIDKKTKYTTLTYLPTKDAWYKQYEKFIRWIKNMKGRAHKVWRTDNGGEFDCKKCRDINDKEGIEHSKTPPYTPNKNSDGERFWRTMIEAIAAMLLTAGMTTAWWVEAATYFIFMKNRTVTSTGKTPYERFYKRKPHKVRLHVFGCLAYVHINKEHRRKGDIKKARKAIFLGVDDSGRYICRDLNTKEIIVSDSVDFVENVFPLGKHKHLKDFEMETIQKLEEDLARRLQMNIDEGQCDDRNGGIQTFKDLIGYTKNFKIHQQPIETDQSKEPIKSELEEEENRLSYGGSESDSDSAEEEENNEEEQSLESKTNTPRHLEHNEDSLREIGIDKTIQDFGIPPLEKVTFANHETVVNRENSTQEKKDIRRTRFEDESIMGEEYFHEKAIDKPPRRSLRSKTTSGENVKLLEHLAQTPPRSRKPNLRMHHKDLEAIANAIIQGTTVPQCYREAMQSPEWPRWKQAIEKEIAALRRTKSLEQVNQLPPGVKAIKCRWVFKIKPPNKQEPEIYKARLVAQGFTQKYGVDYQETFAAVAKMTSLRVLVALAAINNSRLTKLDVANAFLESDIDRDVYIHPPEGFPQNCYFKLKKALYGLKQSPRLFQETITKEFINLGFTPLVTDKCIFKHTTSDTRILVVVDDCIIEGTDENMRKKIEKRLQDRFKIKAFDKVEHFIGLQLEHSSEGIKMHQQDYIESLLAKFNMVNCATVDTPATENPQGSEDLLSTNKEYRKLVGSLIYLMATRPDICSAVTNLSRKLENPTEKDMKAAKRVLRYLAGTKARGIIYRKGQKEAKLTCFSDSDWAGCKKTRKSVSGFVVYFAGAPISWKSKSQPTVAMSSCEAEYVALSVAVREIMWLIQFFGELNVKLDLPIFVFGDNTASIELAKNPVHHERTKHIDIKHHFLREQVLSKRIKLMYVATADNIADVLTKATSQPIFTRHLAKLVSV